MGCKLIKLMAAALMYRMYRWAKQASHHFENVLFAESRDRELSQKIANYLRYHHHLKCHVVNVGGSEQNEAKVLLPEEGFACHGPHNPQRYFSRPPVTGGIKKREE